MIAVLIVWNAALVTAYAIKSMCSTSQVQEGQIAFVTCAFDVDISLHKNDFELSYFAWNESHTNQRIALACHWSGSTPSCWNRIGYSLISGVTDIFTVSINNVSLEHGGQYTCAVVPSEPQSLIKCSLYVISSSPLSQMTAAELSSCKFCNNSTDTQQNTTVLCTDNKIEISVVGALLAASVFCNIYLICCLRNHRALPHCLLSSRHKKDNTETQLRNDRREMETLNNPSHEEDNETIYDEVDDSKRKTGTQPLYPIL